MDIKIEQHNDNVDVYSLDSVITDFLQDNLDPDVLNIIYSIIEVLYKLSEVQMPYAKYDVYELESKIINMLTSDETFDKNDLAISIALTVQTEAFDYLDNLGLTLDRELTYSQLLDILSGLYLVVNIDPSNTDSILRVLDSADTEEYQFLLSSILSDYTEMDQQVLYEHIDLVEDDFLIELYAFLSNKGKNFTNDISDQLVEDIERIYHIEPLAGGTYFMMDIVNNGYEYVNLVDNLDKLYFNISKHCKPVVNTTNIAIEIIVTLFMSTDSRSNMESSYKELVQLDVVKELNEVRTYLENVDKKVLDYIGKIR